MSISTPLRGGKVSTIPDALRYIEDLAWDEFFGTCELIFERGRIVLVRTTRTLKPQELAGRGHREADDGQATR